MKNGRFERKDKSFSKRDKEKSEAGNCSYSSFVTLILRRASGRGYAKVTLMTPLIALCYGGRRHFNDEYLRPVLYLLQTRGYFCV